MACREVAGGWIVAIANGSCATAMRMAGRIKRAVNLARGSINPYLLPSKNSFMRAKNPELCGEVSL